jgi:phage shock protein C
MEEKKAEEKKAEEKKPQVKRLYRSKTDKVIWGICGGLANYFALDPVLIRVIAVVLLIICVFFPTLVAYIILRFVVPEEP